MSTVGKRSYRQLCGLAHALDIVGERWTLLIVRDLSIGARRYSDLAEGLPGIGDALLAQRLRHLESEGIVRRRFEPPPVGAVLYDLTEDGAHLAGALLPLAAWGMRRLPDADDDALLRPEFVALALRAYFDAAASAGMHDVYEVRVDGHPVTIRVEDGSITVSPGAAQDADVRATTDLQTFLAIGSGELDLFEAVELGRWKAEGDRDALRRSVSLFRFPSGGHDGATHRGAAASA